MIRFIFYTDIDGHVDAHVPTFTSTTTDELCTLSIPNFSKEDSDAFCSIMSPLTIAGAEERGGRLAADDFIDSNDLKSAPSMMNKYPRQVWTGIIEGDSDSPFKKLAHAVNNARNFAGTGVSVGTPNDVIQPSNPSTTATIVTGSSITGRTYGPKKKGQAITISKMQPGRVGTGAVTTKARAENKSITKTLKDIPFGTTTSSTSTASPKPMLKRLSVNIQTWAQDALCSAEEYKTLGKVWCEKFDELVIFKSKYGHCSPPSVATTLAAWVHLQRNALSSVEDGSPNPSAPIMKQKLDR